ncbi:MAG: hypothetical protein K1X74_01410 [Pirellulales bacterium]|nr:hypothetical protein [Pirellulales bacterium]
MTNEELTCFEQKVREEHCALVTQCRAIRAGVERAAASHWQVEDTRQIAAALAQLRSEVREHFEAEESDGCMDEALALAPHMAGTARCLMRQHEALLASLTELTAKAQKVNAKAWPKLGEAIKYWIGVLLAHEQAEARMLQAAFNSDFDLDLD